MVLKYNVPSRFRNIYNNQKTIYCEIQQSEELKADDYLVMYKVKMLNCNGFSNIFLNRDLKKLNIIDKIKLIFIK